MKKLPCPRCGKLKRLSVKQMSKMLNPREWEAGWEVQCGNCYMSSGIAQTKEKAVEVWNALPRHLCWTTETPTEPGWYWNRVAGKETLPVRLYYDSNGTLCYQVAGLPYECWLAEALADEPGCEWAGPIPEPQEPR